MLSLIPNQVALSHHQAWLWNGKAQLTRGQPRSQLNCHSHLGWNRLHDHGHGVAWERFVHNTNVPSVMRMVSITH